MCTNWTSGGEKPRQTEALLLRRQEELHLNPTFYHVAVRRNLLQYMACNPPQSHARDFFVTESSNVAVPTLFALDHGGCHAVEKNWGGNHRPNALGLTHAHVAQWIERTRRKVLLQVRVLPWALTRRHIIVTRARSQA